jgi:hypothetical protein
MVKGEALLIDSGLARKVATRIIPSAELVGIDVEDEEQAAAEITVHALAQLPPDTSPGQLKALVEATDISAEQREEVLLALGAKFDDARAQLVGDIGEEIVVQVARDQLSGLGHPELAARVRRVSLGSDALGYDVTAPRTTGSRRLFEVKASTSSEEVRFFLSRNERAISMDYPDDWFLVFCRIDDIERRLGAIVGWCSADSLTPHVPSNNGDGRWESVCLTLPASALHPELPS